MSFLESFDRFDIPFDTSGNACPVCLGSRWVVAERVALAGAPAIRKPPVRKIKCPPCGGSGKRRS